MMRAIWISALLLLSVAIAGCGGSREKGINRDKDRPRSASDKFEVKDRK